jgi:hypothetical protein
MAGRLLSDFQPTPVEWVAGGLSLLFTLISLACTVVNLWLIKRMDVRSGYTRLIQALTFMQLIYDVGLLLVTTYWIDPLHRVCEFLTALGGVGTSLWSNAISFVVVYIVSTMKTFNIDAHYRCMAWSFSAFSLVIAAGVAATKFHPTNTSDVQSETSLVFSKVCVPCPALPCPALPCPALPCPVPSRPVPSCNIHVHVQVLLAALRQHHLQHRGVGRGQPQAAPHGLRERVGICPGRAAEP